MLFSRVYGPPKGPRKIFILFLGLLLTQLSVLWPGSARQALAQALTITSINPNPGFAGDPATIVGQGFDPSDPANNIINFAGLSIPAETVDATGTSLTFIVPDTPPPGPVTITSVNPSIPPVGGGTVTITGTNFEGAPAPLTVTVGGSTSNAINYSSGGANRVMVSVLTGFDTFFFLNLGNSAVHPITATVTSPSSAVATIPPLLNLAPPPDDNVVVIGGRDIRVGFTRVRLKLFDGSLSNVVFLSPFPQITVDDPGVFAPEPPFISPPTETIQIGDTISRTISQPREIPTFEFQGQAGETITIEVDGRDGLDPEIVFFGGSLGVLFDDDSGPGLDAVLSDVTLAESGTFEIEVRSSFDTGFRTTGPFTLSLNAPAALPVDFIDPVPDLLDELTQTTVAAKTKIAQKTETVAGVAADGVARVVARVAAPGAGTVEFTLVDGTSSAEEGFLTELGQTTGSDSLFVPTTDIPGKGPMAFAIYRAPSRFVRAGSPQDANEPDRQVSLRVRFIPQSAGGPTPTSTTPIKIARPPVVPVHGIWSSSAAWDDFRPLIDDSRFQTERIDYSRFSDSGFAISAPLVSSQLGDLIRIYKKKVQVAAIQADVVTHSLGGLLTRQLPLFIVDGIFFRPDNFLKGDVHKLATIATPHLGSALARLLRESSCLSGIFNSTRFRTDRGAVADLVPGNLNLNRLNDAASPLRLHFIVGIASTQQKLDSQASLLFQTMNLACAGAIPPGGLDEIFGTPDHDLIVEASSQRGSFDPSVPHVSTFGPPAEAVIHTRIPGLFIGRKELESEAIAQQVILLLNGVLDLELFESFGGGP